MKRAARLHDGDLATLRLFATDYPVARCILLYGGQREYLIEGRIRVIPLAVALPSLRQILG